MAEFYISLDQEFYNKTLKEAEEEAISILGDEAKGKDAQWTFNNLSVEEWELDESGNLRIAMDTKIGYVSMTIPITNDMMESLISMITKRLNRFESMIESLK